MRIAAVVLLLVVAVGCGKSDSKAVGPDLDPAPLEHHHECAACGMIVAEQSSARAQVVHGDGTRAYFCSIGDMLAYLAAPSPHGKIVGSWVEAMDPTKDPSEFSTDKLPWIPATSASYVIGIDKPRVMGKPVAVYERRADADAAAAKYKGTATDWNGLRGK